MKKLIIGLLGLLILAACSGGSSASVEGTWKLDSYNQTPAAVGIDTNMEFKDGQMNGNVGCNSFGGDYKVSGDTVTFGPVMSTMMFCQGPQIDQEQVTLAVLQKSAKFAMNGNQLTITSEDGISEIVLVKK